MKKLSDITQGLLAVLATPILLVVLLLLPVIVSCSGEDSPDDVSLYALKIITEINTTVYNYAGGVDSVTNRMYERDFYMKTTAQIQELKKEFPAGTTVTDDGGVQYRTVKTKKVSHRLSIHR